MSARIPTLDELARALWELEPRDMTWYELLELTTKDEAGIAARAQLHGLRGKAHRLMVHLFADLLPAPRPPLGVEWAPVPSERVGEAVRLLLPGFDMQVYVNEPFTAETVIKVRRRVEMGAVGIDDYVMRLDEQLGGAIVEFARKMRADAIWAYGLTAAFEAEWDRARHEAREQFRKAVLGLVESTRVWVPAELDEETAEVLREAYLEPLTPQLAELKARIESADG